MSNLFKSNYVVKKEETRVIDSNELIASRLSKLSEEAAKEPEDVKEAGFEEFTEGLNAEQYKMLLEDNPDRAGEFPDPSADPVSEEGEVIQAENVITVDEANEQAEEILRNAGDEASKIREEAEHEAESIRQAARDEGYSEGYDKGRAEAMRIVDEKSQELDKLENERRIEYDKKLEEMEPLLVDAITDIYEHIFHVSLSSNREIMLNLLHDTVRNVEGCKNFIVHVSKDDFEYINDRKDQLMEGLGSTDTIEVIEDLTLRQSECFVEAEGGIYDCGIGTEMELLKKELMLLSYQKG
ncbi:MAG: hypothetical protein K6F34_07695 [Lachnospiraceae bacterium]|nr:hypothetical protein [Lachnospiraceae bacterium]